MTKRVVAFLVACLMVVAFVGCGQKAPTESTASSSDASAQKSESQTPAVPAKESVELTVWMGSWWSEKAPEITKAFEEAYPQYKLKMDCLPINGYFDNAATAIMAGSPPDVLDIDVTQVSTFADKSLLEDLTGSVESKLNADDFIQTAWDLSHYKGKLFGMPTRGSGGLYYYNKTLFDEAGVEYPTKDWTAENLLEMAKKITVPGKKYGVGIAADPSDPSNVMSSFAPFLWSFGGEFMNKDATKATLDTPEAIKGIAFWTELYTKHKVVPEGSINYTISRDVVPMLSNNQVAMLPFGVSGAQTFEKVPGLKWGMITGPDGLSRGGGWTYTIPVSAKHKKEAVDYLLWFAKPEVHAPLCAVEPPTVKAWSLAAPWNTPEYAIILEAAKGGRGLPSFGRWGEAQNIIIKELQKVLQGQSTPEQAGKSMTEQIDALTK